MNGRVLAEVFVPRFDISTGTAVRLLRQALNREPIEAGQRADGQRRPLTEDYEKGGLSDRVLSGDRLEGLSRVPGEGADTVPPTPRTFFGKFR
jgi:hypothetical protein